jgi:hypothetical protein
MRSKAREKLAAGLVVVAQVAVLGACAALLPRTQSQARGPWNSFEEATAVMQKITPGETTRAELTAAGIDPFRTPNITVLTYSDILLRFPVTAALTIEEIDEGLKKCFRAGKKCDGLLVQAREASRDRVGNFWLDSFNFDRPVDVHGWSFNAVIVLVDDVVVYLLYGGQPMLSERERSRNPLGPLQGWGERIPSLLGW